MRSVLLAALRRDGILTRAQALALVADHVIHDALLAGVVVRLFPNVYALPDLARDRPLRRRGALAYRPDSAISHVDGLDVWDLPTCLDDTVHATAAATESATTARGITLHRRKDFVACGPHMVIRRGLRVVRLEQAIVESWPLLPPTDRRLPAIVALRERRTTPARLQETLARQPYTPGAAELRHVFGLAATGCHSPLEMWGHEHVFTDARLPTSRCQVPVDLPMGRIYLDRLIDEVLVNIELDGAAYHGAPGQRERDLRRDAAVATRGVLTVRYSHPRLHADPEGVIEELMRIVAVRRRQFGLDVA